MPRKKPKPKLGWETIKVKENVKTALVRMAGHKQMQEGHKVSLNEVIEDLISFGPTIEVTTRLFEKEPPSENLSESS